MASKLFVGIQEAFDMDETLRPKITPVLNIDQAFRDDVANLFGADNTINVNFNDELANSIRSAFAGTEDKASLIIDYSSDIGSIKSGLESLNSTVTTMHTEWQRMKLVLDSKVLVGEIGPDLDSWLATNSEMGWGRHTTDGFLGLP